MASLAKPHAILARLVACVGVHFCHLACSRCLYKGMNMLFLHFFRLVQVKVVCLAAILREKRGRWEAV